MTFSSRIGVARHLLAVALDHLRPVFDEQHGHRLADVVDRRVEHLARAGRVEPMFTTGWPF